jgi:hypothetical protein
MLTCLLRRLILFAAGMADSHLWSIFALQEAPFTGAGPELRAAERLWALLPPAVQEKLSPEQLNRLQRISRRNAHECNAEDGKELSSTLSLVISSILFLKSLSDPL